MSKKIKKTITTIAAFVLLVFVAFWVWRPSSVEAGWFDDNWMYRNAIPISSHTSLENNVYIAATIDTSASGQFQADCGDLRFTDYVGKVLKYYVVSGCTTASTVVHIFFDTMPAGAQTIYYYYGNSSAVNGFNTADFATQATSYVVGSIGSQEKGGAPVAYYKFDEGTGVTANDSSTNKNNGTITGATWQTEDQCVSGKCLFFNAGTNVVSKTSPVNLPQGGSARTVSMWIKPHLGVNPGVFVQWGDDGGAGQEFILQEYDIGTIYLFTDGVNSNNNITFSGSELLLNDQWNYFAFTVNGTNDWTYYLNGKITKYGTFPTAINTATATILNIGDRTDTGATNFSGFMDEVKIYSYARTAAQIKSDFSSRGTQKGSSASLGSKIQDLGSLSNGLVGYWKTEDVTDSSGNGLTLTNNNSTTFTGGKFGNASTYNGSNKYLNTATSIPGVKSVSFWVNPSSTTDNYINLASGVYINSSSGTISATGTASPTIYVNGAISSTIAASTWSYVTITTDTAVTTNAFEIGRANSAYAGNGTKIDEVRLYNRVLSGKEVRDLYNWAPGPMGYWNFEEGSVGDANDLSGNGYTGTATGTTVVSGKYGRGRSFNGSTDKVVVSSTIAGSQTAEAWIYPTSTTSNILQLSASAYISASSGTMSATGFTSPTIYVNGIVSSTIVANRWQHIAATTATTISANAINLGLANSVYYSGKLDDVKIYNYARTQKQIVEDMNGGHPAGGSPVGSQVGYWKFDEGYGTNANDSTPNDNDLTLSTASWTSAGKFNKAWNGTNALWLSRADDDDFDITATDDYAISLWYKSDSATNPSATEYLVNKANATTAGYAIYANTSGQICFGIDDDATWDPDVTSCTSSDFYDATWHYIAAIRDTVSDKTYLYIDGISRDSDADTTTATLANALSLYVGDRDGTDNGDEFAGDIDELKIYRLALTSDEVAVDFNRGSAMAAGAPPVLGNYCVPGAADTCTAPVGEWNFEEGSGQSANDSSGSGNTGTLGATGAVASDDPSWTIGKIGKALSFDGSNDYMGIGSSGLPTGSFTLELWLKRAGVTASYQTAIFFYTFGAVNVQVNLNGSGSNAKLITYYVRDSSNNVIDNYISSVDSSDGAWHHAAITITKSGSLADAAFYVDGKQVRSVTGATSNGNFLSTADTREIGAATAPGEYFKGSLDGIKIFGYARTPAQIAWDYNRGAPVGHLKLDECQSATINDSSGYNNVGTITIGGSGTQTAIGTCITSGAWFNGVSGKYNSSLNFDGSDDYISVADSGSLNVTSTITASVWTKPASTTQTNWADFLGKITGGTFYGYEIQTNNASPKGFRCRVASASGETNLDSITTYSAGVWYHVACVADGSTLKIYVNGVEENSTSSSILPGSTSTIPMLIGKNPSNNFFWNGQIDDVKVFNYALTAAQIKMLFNENSSVRFGP